ncbi:hypothetical protein ACQP1G_30445 [Nocardia sp. CA-107356]|uniref:hypothetical protein n=1 Tax=Nocardia sp. CA-107356 TaxID=3239972 RepID=UPI003D93F788
MSLPGASPPPEAGLPDPAVLELLRGSALAPMLDHPVDHILRSLGLPGLPDLQGIPPLPGLPPLPVIDLGALMRPLTDLVSAFGAGRFAPPPEAAPAPAPVPEGTVPQGNPEAHPAPAGQPAAAPLPPGMDPVQMLSNLSGVLQSAMPLASSALSLLMSQSQGQGAEEVARKAAAASADSAALEVQNAGEQQSLLGAAASVAVGSAQLAGVVAKQSAVMAMAPLFIVSGVGQVFLVQQTIESITEALGITAKTKGELGVHSVDMAKTGVKIPVTGAPDGVKSSQDVSQMLSMLTSLMSMGPQAIGQPAKSNSSTSAAVSVAEPDAVANGGAGGAVAVSGAGGRVVGGGAVGTAGGGVAAGRPAQPLTPWQGTRAAGGGSAAAAPAGSEMSSGASQKSTTGPGGSSPYMPLGGAGAARGGAASGDEAVRADLVTGEHGDEVVGRIDRVSLPVVGATDVTAAPGPDKEFTL